MYTPTAFDQPDLARVHALVEAHEFATLVAVRPDGDVEIAHLPFLLDKGGDRREDDGRGDGDRRDRLLVHVARANPIWKIALDGAPLTVVFNGPDGYVSPSWYEEPERQVPTWNYAVVHAHGRAEGPMDEAELLATLGRLTERYEAASARPWRLGAMDADARASLLGAIVGFAIPVERLQAKFKLSQNRTPEDRRRVFDALAARGLPDDRAMIELMDS